MLEKKLNCLEKTRTNRSKPHWFGLVWILFLKSTKSNQTKPHNFLSCGSDDFYLQNQTKPHREYPYLKGWSLHRKRGPRVKSPLGGRLLMLKILIVNAHMPRVMFQRVKVHVLTLAPAHKLRLLLQNQNLMCKDHTFHKFHISWDLTLKTLWMLEGMVILVSGS